MRLLGTIQLFDKKSIFSTSWVILPTIVGTLFLIIYEKANIIQTQQCLLGVAMPGQRDDGLVFLVFLNRRLGEFDLGHAKQPCQKWVIRVSVFTIYGILTIITFLI